jgi:hypothetical protein
VSDRATIAEASHLTGASERRPSRWVAAGHLPHVAGPCGRLVSVAVERELAGLGVSPAGETVTGRADLVEAGHPTGGDRQMKEW